MLLISSHLFIAFDYPGWEKFIWAPLCHSAFNYYKI